jgi:hypothetical protein
VAGLKPEVLAHATEPSNLPATQFYRSFCYNAEPFHFAVEGAERFGNAGERGNYLL